MKTGLTTFASGLLFAVGLGVAGMTQPTAVRGFLNVSGSWDPTLLFVIVSAVAAYNVFYRLARRRQVALLGDPIALPTSRAITPQLVIGGAIFGAGWALAGLCPGPALAAVLTSPSVALFVIAMIGGMLIYQAQERFQRARDAAARPLAIERIEERV